MRRNNQITSQFAGMMLFDGFERNFKWKIYCAEIALNGEGCEVTAVKKKNGRWIAC
jgi:hypothetical protein